MRKFTYMLFLGILFITMGMSTFAQETFNRVYSIPVPQIENTGFGEVVAGVDFDGDGKQEIYAVNNMLDQGGAELIPRIYKFEYNGLAWDSVWSATITDIDAQNSWAALTYGDMDGDGKMELIWGPANNFSGSYPNPPRILVFEAPGDGSEAMGISSFGNYLPNAQWTITDQDNYNLRPFKWMLKDMNNDGKPELIFADRVSAYNYGVVSVSDIPDNGDHSETWTLVASGENSGMDAASIYDMAIVNKTIILFHSDGTVTPVYYDNGAYNVMPELPNFIPGGSWKSASTVDLNGDGNEEVLVGGWADAQSHQIHLIQESNGTLTDKVIADLGSLIGASGRINGGDAGDIDLNGKPDIVFGTRNAEPNGAIVRMEFNGGDITDSANYTYSVIDSLLSDDANQRFDVVKIGNVDDDPENEVVYTDGNQPGLMPIAILDPQIVNAVNDGANRPNKFYLSQNFPNPFNPSTTISFGIKEETTVTLSVFNSLGQEVQTLISNKTKPAGNYSVTFNADNLASGMYIYILKTGNKIISKKMTLLK